MKNIIFSIIFSAVLNFCSAQDSICVSELKYYNISVERIDSVIKEIRYLSSDRNRILYIQKFYWSGDVDYVTLVNSLKDENFFYMRISPKYYNQKSEDIIKNKRKKHPDEKYFKIYNKGVITEFSIDKKGNILSFSNSIPGINKAIFYSIELNNISTIKSVSECLIDSSWAGLFKIPWKVDTIFMDSIEVYENYFASQPPFIKNFKLKPNTMSHFFYSEHLNNQFIDEKRKTSNK